MAEENFSNPRQCRVTDCGVALVVRDEDGEQSRLYACKHKLADLSEYFDTLLYGDFKEKNKKEVNIEDVTKTELLQFLRWAHQHPKALQVKDVESLCALIFLADRFLCPTLETAILDLLAQESIIKPCDQVQAEESIIQPYAEDQPGRRKRRASRSTVSSSSSRSSSPYSSSGSEEYEEKEDCSDVPSEADWKLKLLEVAEKHKGRGACVLEACIRRCADLKIEQVAPLHGKVSGGTLAAVYATVGCAKDVILSKFTSRARNQNKIEFSEIKKIKIDNNLVST